MNTQLRLTSCGSFDYIKIFKALTQFNQRHVGIESIAEMATPLRYALKRHWIRCMGGVTGYLYCGHWLSIDNLWVHEAYQGQGYGTALLGRIEAEAHRLGATMAQVDTYSFQALDFYRKLGYTVFGELENCPKPGAARYYLKKDL